MILIKLQKQLPMNPIKLNLFDMDVNLEYGVTQS